MSFNVKALGAFRKLGAAVLIIAAILAMVLTACPQSDGGGGTPPAPPTKYAITFSVDSTTPNGTLKAKADGVDETSTSPINVEEGKTVTFTAKANTGYRVKGWTLDGNAVNGTAETYTLLAVTQPATVKVSFELIPQAILTLSPDNLTIEVRAKTADGNPITVEGCNEATLESDKKTKLTVTGTRVVLKGNITELSCSWNQLTALDVQSLTSLRTLNCSDNQLTALNVQGLTSLRTLDCHKNQLTALNVQGCASLQKLDCHKNQLTELNLQGLTSLQGLYCFKNQLTALNVQGCASLQKLWCYNNKLTELNVQGCTALKYLSCESNQLNAKAMTALLNALPAREASAKAVLYTEKTGETEGNHKDFSQPADLKKAFEDANSKNWKLQKVNASGDFVEI